MHVGAVESSSSPCHMGPTIFQWMVQMPGAGDLLRHKILPFPCFIWGLRRDCSYERVHGRENFRVALP